MAYLTNFFFEFFMQFLPKMPLYFFFTKVQKSQNDQKLKSRGPALNSIPNFLLCSVVCRRVRAGATAGHPKRLKINSVQPVLYGKVRSFWIERSLLLGSFRFKLFHFSPTKIEEPTPGAVFFVLSRSQFFYIFVGEKERVWLRNFLPWKFLLVPVQ